MAYAKILPERFPGKSLEIFYEGLRIYRENVPNDKKPCVYCSESVYQQIKKLPEAFLRGRWLYINYNNTIFSVRKVKTK